MSPRFSMFKMLGLPVAVCVVVSMVGCGMTPAASNTTAVRHLVRDHGGWPHQPAHQAQAEALLASLPPCLGESTDFTPRIRVIATSAPVAYAVAPCDVLVSEGLLDWATPDQVRAAVAHELGHLIEAEDGVVSALLGQPGMECPEARADHLGVGLLDAAGYDSSAMATLLSDLANHPTIH